MNSHHPSVVGSRQAGILHRREKRNCARGPTISAIAGIRHLVVVEPPTGVLAGKLHLHAGRSPNCIPGLAAVSGSIELATLRTARAHISGIVVEKINIFRMA